MEGSATLSSAGASLWPALVSLADFDALERLQGQQRQAQLSRLAARAAQEAGGAEPAEEEIVEAVRAARDALYRSGMAQRRLRVATFALALARGGEHYVIERRGNPLCRPGQALASSHTHVEPPPPSLTMGVSLF
ncbi:MAG: hypothetical protein Q8Q00_05020 [Dehalococcoidia bacterium]|nr:hypothetical protein [Dehalococcoidia bacterium]